MPAFFDEGLKTAVLSDILNVSRTPCSVGMNSRDGFQICRMNMSDAADFLGLRNEYGNLSE